MATVTLRVDDELRDKLAERAAFEGMSVSEYIRSLIDADLLAEEVVRDRQFESLGPPRRDLSEYERKLLALLYEVKQRVSPDVDEEDATALEVLRGGYPGGYGAVFEEINEGLTYNECQLVWDILDMFRQILWGVERLPEKWASLDVEDAEHFGTLSGFDGNDVYELSLLSYAQHLVRQGKWQELAPRFSAENSWGNSHTQMLPTYRRMLSTFKPLWRRSVESGGPLRLDKLAIEKVLLSVPHSKPTNR